MAKIIIPKDQETKVGEKIIVDDGIDTERPYRGIYSFEEIHRNIFYGRNRQAEELLRLIKNNTLTILFGKSGIGKSSLLNAGLIPRLKEDYFLPILIRIKFDDLSSLPIEQTKDTIEKSVQKIEPDFRLDGTQTLWEIFRSLKVLSGVLIPVMVFDQFEELFTLGRKNQERAKSFVEELSDLIENRIPSKFKDQETFYTNATTQLFRVVISLREDFLAPLELLSKRIPSLNKIRFRLLPLHGEDALDAVYKPGSHLMGLEEATAILNKLIPETERSGFESTNEIWSDSDFEPAILSLYCQQLNEGRIKNQQPRINHELINTISVDAIIESYYNECIDRHKLVSHKDFRTDIEENLISEDGYRLLVPLEKDDSFYHIPKNTIDQLVNDRILRKETRNRITHIELSHDLIAKVVAKQRKVRIDRLKQLEFEQKEKEITENYNRQQRNWYKWLGVSILLILVLAGLASTAFIFYQKADSRKTVLTSLSDSLARQATKNNALYISERKIAKVNDSLYQKQLEMANRLEMDKAMLNDNLILLRRSTYKIKMQQKTIEVKNSDLTRNYATTNEVLKELIEERTDEIRNQMGVDPYRAYKTADDLRNLVLKYDTAQFEKSVTNSVNDIYLMTLNNSPFFSRISSSTTGISEDGTYFIRPYVKRDSSFLNVVFLNAEQSSDTTIFLYALDNHLATVDSGFSAKADLFHIMRKNVPVQNFEKTDAATKQYSNNRSDVYPNVKDSAAEYQVLFFFIDGKNKSVYSENKVLRSFSRPDLEDSESGVLLLTYTPSQGKSNSYEEQLEHTNIIYYKRTVGQNYYQFLQETSFRYEKPFLYGIGENFEMQIKLFKDESLPKEYYLKFEDTPPIKIDVADSLLDDLFAVIDTSGVLKVAAILNEDTITRLNFYNSIGKMANTFIFKKRLYLEDFSFQPNRFYCPISDNSFISSDFFGKNIDTIRLDNYPVIAYSYNNTTILKRDSSALAPISSLDVTNLSSSSRIIATNISLSFDKRFLTAQKGNTIWVFSAKEPYPLLSSSVFSENYTRLTFTNDDRYLILGSYGNYIIWLYRKSPQIKLPDVDSFKSSTLIPFGRTWGAYLHAEEY